MSLRSRLWITAACCTFSLPAGLLAQDARAELLTADRSMSALSSDSGLKFALVRSLDHDGVLLWPGAPVLVGPGEAQRVLVSTQDSTRLLWQPLGAEMSADSMMGVSWGIAVTAPRLTPGAPHIGRYAAVWHRLNDKWSVSALLFTNVQPVISRVPADVPMTRSPLHPRGAAGRFVNADLAFAQLARDSGAVKAFRTWAAPNAFVIGGILTRGPAAIAQGVEGPASWRWHPVAAGSSRSGDFGWTAGEAVISPDKDLPMYSKYLTIWIKTPENSTRFLTDGGNARPADPASR